MNRKYLVILLICMNLILDAFWALTFWPPFFSSPDIVPLLGFPQSITYIFLWFFLPLIGGILAVVIFPRIIAPLFMMFKRVYMKQYENAYIETKKQSFTSSFLGRYIYSYLLLIGFMTLAVKFIPAELLLSEFAFENLPLIGQDPQTHITFLISAGGLLSAFVVGLWSVGWSMEEAGLTHFSLMSEESGGLRELEPVHVRYNSYIKGYAGISSVLFVIGMALSLFAEGRLMEIIGILTLPLHIILMLTPSMYIHSKLSSTWLRRGIPLAKNNLLQRTDLIEENE